MTTPTSTNAPKPGIPKRSYVRKLNPGMKSSSEAKRSTDTPLKVSGGETNTVSGVPSVTWPESWIKGQLLDVRRFSDGSFRVYELGAHDDLAPHMDFDSSFAAQQFISWWYQREP